MKFFLALGSNVGDRASNLQRSIAALERYEIHLTKRSSVYETDPVGGPEGQQPYLNQVVEVETLLTARALLTTIREIEASGGRDRTKEERWGPRTIDIDILLGDEHVSEPDLEIPHPRIAGRAFVLVPLAEIAPDAHVAGETAADLAKRAGAAGVRLIGTN